MYAKKVGLGEGGQPLRAHETLMCQNAFLFFIFWVDFFKFNIIYLSYLSMLSGIGFWRPSVDPSCGDKIDIKNGTHIFFPNQNNLACWHEL
jgi:hypothetical protein